MSLMDAMREIRELRTAEASLPATVVVAYTTEEGGKWWKVCIESIRDCIHVNVNAPTLLKQPFKEWFNVSDVTAIKLANGDIYDFVLGTWRHLYGQQVTQAVKQHAQSMEAAMIHPANKAEHLSINEAMRQAQSNIDATLAERGSRYGSFEEHARITQNIKDAMKDSKNWSKLAPNQKECLEMIAHKAGRILNGDPDYHDSWHDIVGYTKLVADELLGDSK